MTKKSTGNQRGTAIKRELPLLIVSALVAVAVGAALTDSQQRYLRLGYAFVLENFVLTAGGVTGAAVCIVAFAVSARWRKHRPQIVHAIGAIILATFVGGALQFALASNDMALGNIAIVGLFETEDNHLTPAPASAAFVDGFLAFLNSTETHECMGTTLAAARATPHAFRLLSVNQTNFETYLTDAYQASVFGIWGILDPRGNLIEARLQPLPRDVISGASGQFNLWGNQFLTVYNNPDVGRASAIRFGALTAAALIGFTLQGAKAEDREWPFLCLDESARLLHAARTELEQYPGLSAVVRQHSFLFDPLVFYDRGRWHDRFDKLNLAIDAYVQAAYVNPWFPHLTSESFVRSVAIRTIRRSTKPADYLRRLEKTHPDGRLREDLDDLEKQFELARQDHNLTGNLYGTDEAATLELLVSAVRRTNDQTKLDQFDALAAKFPSNGAIQLFWGDALSAYYMQHLDDKSLLKRAIEKYDMARRLEPLLLPAYARSFAHYMDLAELEPLNAETLREQGTRALQEMAIAAVRFKSELLKSQ